MAATREAAYKIFDRTLARYEAKDPKAMECLGKDRDKLLAFYDFSAEYWISIRTANSIESSF